MSNLGYREFTKQIAMLTEYEKMSVEDKHQHMLLACDIDIYGKTGKNVKKYAIIKYSLLFPFISRLRPEERCYNELIKKDIICRQFFDLDAPKTEENKDKIEYVKNNLHNDFFNFWNDMVTANEFGCKVLLDRRDHEHKNKTLPITMNTYSSSSDIKFSWHIIFPEIVMQNHFHCGAICRRFEIWLINKYSDDTTKNPYYITDKKGLVNLIIDRSIYTNNRVFRLLYNTKGGQKRPLKPDLQSKYNITTKEIELKEMIRYSSPDVLMIESYLQYPLNYESFDYHSCCEARSYLVYETDRTAIDSIYDENSMVRTSDRFEWIEPYSIGSRITTMSQSRLKRMRMNQFLGSSGNNNPINNTGKTLLSYSSTSPPLYPNNDDSSSTSRFNNISNEIQKRKYDVIIQNMAYHKNISFDMFKLSQKDKKMEKKLTKSYQSLIETSRKYIAERCYPNWLNSKIDLSFIDLSVERTINLENCSIHVYPKNAKCCQFRGFSDHTSNHIYFVIYCNPIVSNNNIGFYQKCHSFNHFGPTISKINQPFRNDLEEKLFKDMQKKFKKYIFNLSDMNYSYISTTINNDEIKLSVWILISLFNTLFSHFIKSIPQDLFSLYNRNANTELIFKSVEKLNHHFHYYIDMMKNQKIDKHIFISIIDSIVAKSIHYLTKKDMKKYYLKMYCIYRSNIIVFSISNVFSTNNFNNLIEEMFIEVLKYNNVDLKLHEKTRIPGKKRNKNNMLYIYRLAAMTEKKIIDKYKKYKKQKKDDNTENETILDSFIDKMATNNIKFMEDNYKNLIDNNNNK